MLARDLQLTPGLRDLLASAGQAPPAYYNWMDLEEASRISDDIQKRQLDESSPVQKISELDWIPNWLKTRPIILGQRAETASTDNQ